MNALREIISPKNGRLSIVIPKNFNQKRFEVIVIPIEDNEPTTFIKSQMDAFLKTLPNAEPQIDNDLILNEIKEIRQKRYERNQH